MKNWLVVLVIFVLVLGARRAFADQPKVEVTYTTVGWFWDNSYVGNSTWLILNVTITNNGYSLVQGLHLIGDAFYVTVSNVVYSTSPVPIPLYNDSGPQNITGTDLCLSSVQIANGGTLTGLLGFQFNPAIFGQPFTVQTQFYDENWNGVNSTATEIPEFQTFLILPFFLIATLAAMLYKKKAVQRAPSCSPFSFTVDLGP